jgi:hypothetical protein
VARGQRLGIGDVEGSAHPTRLRVPHERFGVDHPATGDVDQQRTVGHRRQELVVDQPCRRLAQRHDHDDDVVMGQQVR